MMPRKYFFATLIGALGLIMWAFSALLVVSLKSIPTFEILSIVFSISFSLTMIKIAIYKEWYKLKQPIVLYIIGFLGIYGNDVLYISAFKEAPSIQVDLISYLWPIMVVVFAGLLPREKFTFKHTFSGMLGMLGIYILLTGGHGLVGFEMKYILGYFLAFCDALTWTLYTLAIRHYQTKSVEMIGVYYGLGAIISFILHNKLEVTVIPSMHQGTILLIMGLTTQGLAYFFWDYAVKEGNFKLLSILSYANPIISVALLILFGLSKSSGSIILACLCVSGAGLIASIQWPNIKFLTPLKFKKAII